MSPKAKLNLGRYDYASYGAFTAYALCSLAIPIALVAMGRELAFPLEQGGMAAGGVLHFVRSAAMVVALLLCGIVAGRWGKRRSMGFCMLCMGGGIVLCAFAPAYWALIPCLLAAGFGEGICEGLATPFVQALHEEAPERYVNIAHAFWSVGVGLCVLLAGGLLSLGVSWRCVLGGAGVAAMLVSLGFLYRETPGRRYPELREAVHSLEVWRYSVAIARTPRFWVYSLGMFLGAGAEFCLTFWAATYLQLNFNAGAWFAGLGTAAIALGMFLGRTVFGYFATPGRLRWILLGAGVGTIPVTLLLTLLTPEMFAAPWMLFGALFGLLFLAGIGIAPYWPTLQVYGVGKLPELDSTMLYIYFSSVGIPGCGFFTWLLGVLGDRYGLRAAFVMIPVTLAGFSLLVLLEGWGFPRREAPKAPVK